MRKHFEELNFTEPLQLDKVFKFQCSACGKCCSNLETNQIKLSAGDIVRIARLKNCTCYELRNYFATTQGKQFHLPEVRLKTVGSRCILLKKGKCTIHEANPRTCSLYPLARGIHISKIGNPTTTYHIDRAMPCPPSVIKNGLTRTISQMVEDSNVPLDDVDDITWLSCLLDITHFIHGNPKFNSKKVLHGLTKLLYYDYDTSQDLPDQIKCNFIKAKEIIKTKCT